jgi:hypothetical protein
MHAYTFMAKDVECTTNELNPTTVVPLYSLMISKIIFLLSNRKFIFKNIFPMNLNITLVSYKKCILTIRLT